MKFLCDRCKTRYSISDERVRGKILKIRCKNCANIITVREGMTVAEDERRGRPTTAAPFDASPPAPPAFAGAGGSPALASAFAQQLAKPPPALDEEWYVSIDGVQSGPFGLAEAQKWVAGKAADADLHCWSEGFDDWLPVDKVSHFRGLRKKPSGAQPSVVRPLPPAPPPPPEDEPKPLFAATMASLEKAAATIPPPIAAAAAPPPTSPPPLAANGAPLAPVTTPPSSPIKAPTKTVIGVGSTTGPAAAILSTPSTPASPPKANGTGPSPRMPTPTPFRALGAKPNGTGTGPSAAQSALAAAFDVPSEPERPERATTSSDAFADLAPRAAAAPTPAPAPPPDDDDDSNLDIGEVSRVVNLADLARQAPKPRAPTSSQPALRRTASVQRLDPAALGAGVAANAGIADPSAAQAGLAAMPTVESNDAHDAHEHHVARDHRRGLIMLISVAGVLLAGVAVLVVLMLNKNSGDDNSDPSLGKVQVVDVSRPDEVVRVAAHMAEPDTGSNATVQKKPPVHVPTQKIATPGPNQTPETPDVPNAHLQPEEIEDMARKQSAGTQRCYMRAQRGVDGVELADIKKIYVTLAVDKTGAVTDVQVADHQTDTLGTCLQSQIKRWKFRESSGGSFKIALALAEN